MRYPLTVVPGPWQPQVWQDVFFEDATDVLLDLCDAVDDGRLDTLAPHLNRISQLTQGRWRFSTSMAIPILSALCHEVAMGGTLDLELYKARLALCAGKPGQLMTFPMDIFNLLQPKAAYDLLRLGPVRLVA